MNITPDALRGEVARARAQWPFVDTVNAAHRLPEALLIAVMSRETNCQNEPGDPAPRPGVDPPDWPGKPYHAWSPWQIDRNSGGTPDLLNHPDVACGIAGGMLRGHIDHFGGDLLAGVCAYNAGDGGVLAHRSNPDMATTGKNYGSDTLGRRSWIAQNMPVSHQPPETDMPNPRDVTCSLTPPPGHPDFGSSWILRFSGEVDTVAGTRFYGSYASLPHQLGIAAFYTMTLRPDGKPGYVLVRTDGARYTFPA